MHNFLKIRNFVILLEVAFHFILSLKICDEWNLIFDRWKRNRHKEDRATPEASNSLSKVHDENVQVESSVDKYSAVNGKGTEEDMYYESQNQYDILGKKRSKTKVQEDNFYNMSENPVNQNEYARADQVSKRVSDTEDVYDHTNGSDMYGVSLVIESENVYNQSESWDPYASP